MTQTLALLKAESKTCSDDAGLRWELCTALNVLH
jgi:hypothetical protein